MGNLLLAAAAAAVIIVPPCGAEMFSLNDRNYPHVFINDPVTVPVIWHKKAFGFRLANAAAVRINARCAHLPRALPDCE